MSKLVFVLSAVLVTGAVAWAQTGSPQPQQPTNTQSAGEATPAPRPDPARQMQLDLDQMDSLLNNMAAQVSFIHDTNMSILLNTNVRLWSTLLRDLRLQMEEQQKSAAPDKTWPQKGKNTAPQKQ